LRYRASVVSLFLLWQLLATIAWALPAESTTPELAGERDDYSKATRAIRYGGSKDYEQLRSSLDNYPLAVYLDYYKLSAQPARVRPNEARRFLESSQDTPLPNRFLAVYLNRAGRDRRWQDFLQVMPSEPNDIVLKCYYFRAKLSGGDKQTAWDGAEKLWVYGKSRPKECDPLFGAWLKVDELTDEVVWARLLETFEARQKSLMTYVARKGSDALKPWSDKLLAVYAKPDRMARQSLPDSSPYSGDIASYGVAYLARYNPEKALSTWLAYKKTLSFTPAQIRRAEYAITLRSLYAKTDTNVPWLDSALLHLGDDKLFEIRLRWALGEGDWATVLSTVPNLSEVRSSSGAWRYWLAIAQENLGQSEEAKKGLATLALDRGYYSFLAADKLGEAYAFNSVGASDIQPPTMPQTPFAALPGVKRIEELYFHDEDQAAHSEWYKMLGDSDAPRQESLADYASTQGWYRMAIDGANRAKAWDRLDLRFPMPFQDTFDRYASVQKVPSTELMAIARRESAFYPSARSPVGARGLMQLMPATGRQVAKTLGAPHKSADLYEVEHNVLLGSTYYKQLLDRYQGNRVYAIAAYNAGPHRVDRWKNKAGEKVSVEIWVATIPFKETRNYVQAVLSYNVVFHHLLGVDRSLLTLTELQASY